jgi:integrase
VAERALGNFNAKPRDPLFASPEPAPKPPILQDGTDPETHTLAQVIQRYIAENQNGWAERTKEKYAANLKICSEIIGPETDIKIITKSHIRNLKDVNKIPSNWTKRFPGKTAREVAALSKDQQAPLLSEASINAYLVSLSSLFTWASNQGFAEGNPVSRMFVKDPVRDKDKRYPFSADQLGVLFSAPVFTGMKSEHYWKDPGTVLVKDAHYWVPLIGLYSGMRRGEIMSLTRDTVHPSNGIHIFDILEAKSEAGVRQVPIHPVLIELGLLEYVKTIDPGAALFPDITGDAFGKRFSRLLQSRGIKNKKLTFHSLRHTMVDALRAANVQEPLQKAIIGHSDGTVTSQYGSGWPLPLRHKAMSKVSHPAVERIFGCGHLSMSPCVEE